MEISRAAIDKLISSADDALKANAAPNLTESVKYIEMLRHYKTIRALALYYELENINNYANVEHDNNLTELAKACAAFRGELEAMLLISGIENVAVAEVDTAKVNIPDSWKREIRQHIQEIKSELDKSGLSGRLKQSILNKLANFEAEIERDVTRIDALNAVFVDVTYAFSAGVTNLFRPTRILTNIIGAIAKLHGVGDIVLPAPDIIFPKLTD